MKLHIYRKSLFILLAFVVFFLHENQSGFSQSVEEKNIKFDKSTDQKLFSNSDSRIAFLSLPQNFEFNGVRCILKDYKGYMWFATIDGLIRFDGIQIYVYEHDPDDSTSISHSSVNSIVEDANNNLWIGTSKGLNLYNREQDNFIPVGSINEDLDRLNYNYIRTLSVDDNGLLWVGTFGDGLNLYDPEKMEIYHYSYNAGDPKSISSTQITCIAMDMDGNVWLGTQNGLNLFVEEENGFKKFYAEEGNPHSLSSNNIRCMALDPEGYLWVGTRGGGVNKVIKKDGSYSFLHYKTTSIPGSLSNNNVLSLVSDDKGNLWIGTDNGGLNCLQISTDFIKVSRVEEGNPHSLSSNSIWSLYNDNEGRLWIGTYNRGINVIDEKMSKFESFQKNIVDKNSLPDNDVTGFTEDSQGYIWIATDGGGICRFNPETHRFDRIIRNSETRKPLMNNNIQCILSDSQDNLWIGTWSGGIDRLNKRGEKIRNYPLKSEEGAGDNNVLCLYEDSRGNIWAGTAGSGLFIFKESIDAFEQVLSSNSSGIISRTAYVTSMLEDSDGNFWVGTLFGFVILENGPNGEFLCTNFSTTDNVSGMSSNMVICIFEDRNKGLWFGTGDFGITLYNREDGSFVSFNRKDGLPGNLIRGILEDDKGNLWITTSKGLSKFNCDSLNFTNYTREDGLNSNEFYERSCLRTTKGEFYIGGENGFNVFYPQNIRNNSVIPPVYLTNLKINNAIVEIGSKNSPLLKHISETEEITLNNKQSSFTIEFIALNFTHSSRNQYSYKLEGFDDNWNFAGNRRSASYTNVKPGNYVFLVKGANNDGIWNPVPARLVIQMKQPYYKTWWAILIYLSLISILAFFSFRIWNERIRIKHQLRLEQLGREKEHELNEANIQFFTNISHEFRTPLSLIIAPLESLLLSAHSKMKEQLLVIYRNAQRLLQLTNNLMDFRKLEEGRTTLKVRHGEIINFIREVSSYFRVNFKRRKINFTITAGDKTIQAWFDPEKLETILLNLLSNAAKYTPDGGDIHIRVNSMNSAIAKKKYEFSGEETNAATRYTEIEVIDNGSGISAEDLPFIFEKFYQSLVAKKRKNKGTGIGLALTKGLVELNHGRIKVSSIPKRETRFSFVLPVDRVAFNEDEIVNEPTSVLSTSITNEPEDISAKRHEREPENADQTEKKEEILIAEDNYELRTFLVKELSNSYSIIYAENGKIGIELALDKVPDLIISDILMPQCTGIELCNLLKADIRTSHIPIILLTAKTTVNDQIEGVEIGADAYITKPFNMQFLRAKINQLIQSRKKLYANFSQDVYLMPNKMAENELDQKFLQKAIDCILMNIADNTLNVEGLAATLNLSRSNVYRKIKALTGKTIIEFIRIVRLKQAIKLMETKKYSLAEIAYLTGFTSPSYFTKSFKDQYGRPPSEFLNS